MNRAHALANLFLVAFGAGENPDPEKHDDDDQKRQYGD
jgi:hypothetical protein